MTEKIHIRAFYRFVDLPNYEQMKKPFRQFCLANDMRGTILLASEGINATVAATKEVIEKFWDFLNQDIRFKDMPFKESHSEFQPFERMKVRLKKEIVRLDVEGLNMNDRGEYVKGEDWDKLISDPEVVLVDTRNFYEVKLGTFENALDPKTEDFRNFPKWVDENLDPQKNKKVAMFCTGGIRCEKSTALLKQKGFDKVYHLDGGILQYFEDTQNKNKKWKGGCFVFDDRIAVNDKLKPVDKTICKLCGHILPVSHDVVGKNNKGTSCKTLGVECLNDEAIVR